MTRHRSLKLKALAFRKFAELLEIKAELCKPKKPRPTPKEKKQADIDALIARVQAGQHRGRPRK
ncbi:MAG: hypothetical protein BGO31_15600 [Bacteroidetes bacterium 43-16]|nr:MAG: hypothetical protein BGO31_15600 [Bacteroidetes bacterium 43-16]